MNHFQAYVTTYGQSLSCPDPLMLYDYGAQALAADARAEVESHLAACPACREILAELQQIPCESVEIALPESLPTLNREPAQAAIRPLLLQPGQVWLLKGAIDLAQQGLPTPPQGPATLETGYLRLVVITTVGKKHLGKATFQELGICPISEELLMASARDLVLESPSLSALGPCMIETWNPQTILALQLQDCLGSLSAQELMQLQGLIEAASAEPFVAPAGIPHGGEIAHPAGPHDQFHTLEHNQAACLNLPYQALQSAIKEMRPYLAEIGKGRLKAASSDKAPKWLRIPRSYQPELPSATVLAASAAEEAAPETAALNQRELFRLLEDMLLEIWVEGENLEFYCRRAQGEDLEGLSIRYTDAAGQELQTRTDELGTAFIPLENFPQGEAVLLEFGWQEQSWNYPFIIPAA